MSKYVLRWQYGLFNDEVKIHYAYGEKEALKEKAKLLAENEKILVITLDKVEEVIKDTRENILIEYAKQNEGQGNAPFITL